MISIQNNMGGMRAMDGLQQSHLQLQVSLERLSTGLRINRAEDDAAGVMQRDRFTSQTQGLTEAIRNIQTAQGMVQVAEQGLNKVTEALQQMRSLAVRAADDNLNDTDRSNIQNQITGLLKEINSRAQTTVYNGHKLLDGSITDSVQARNGSAKIQTNSFLANGQDLVSGAVTTGTSATTVGGISQGSYEIKIVDPSNGAAPGITPTSSTQLAGIVNSPSNAASTTTLNQVVTDRNGGAHVASFTFSELSAGNRNYNYSVTVKGSGVYGADQTYSGTMTFGADGSLAAVDGHPPGALQRNVTISDGTATGQAWSIDFSGLVENQQKIPTAAGPSTISAVTPNGSGGASTTSAVMAGNLEQANAVGKVSTLTVNNWTDRLGVTKPGVQIQFTKASNGGSNNTDTWNWSVVGGSVAGFGTGGASITAGGSGTIDFANALTKSGSVTVTDSAGVAQTVALDFSAMTNVNDAVNTPSAPSTHGGTAVVTFAGNMDTSVGGGIGLGTFGLRDSQGNGGLGPDVDFTWNGGNSWSWTVNPFTVPGGSSITGGGAGTFDTTIPNNHGTVQITDGAGHVQNLNLDFSGLSTATGVGGSALTAHMTGSSTATTDSVLTGNLDDANANGKVVNTTASGWTDYNGAALNAQLSFTKTGSGNWTWAVNAGSVAGFGSGGATVVDMGSTAINLSSPGSSYFTLQDSSGHRQTFNLDFTSLTHTDNSVNNPSQTSQNGTTGTPTSSVAVTASLNPASSPVSTTVSVRDRTNVNNIAGNQVQFAYLGGNDWSYTITPNNAGGPTDQFTGTGTNLSGTLSLNGSGAVASVNNVAGNTVSTLWNTSTGEQQAITFDFSAVTRPTAGPVAISNGADAPSTGLSAGVSTLSSTHVVSDTVTTSPIQVFDRTSTDHSVSISYSKLSADATGQTWAYSVNGLSGGVWTGANSGNTTGTVHFNSGGTLDAINGAAPAAQNMVIGDGTAAGQALSLNLTGLSVAAGPDNMNNVTQAGGSTGNPTTQITLINNLTSGAGPATVAIDIFDRTGTDLTSTTAAVTTKPSMTLSQVGSTNTWNYTITAPIGSGFTGFGTNLQGQVQFNAAGNMTSLDGTSTLNKVINLSDGTAEGQSINIDFAHLHMATASALTTSSTDGGTAANQGEVHAVIYYSDGAHSALNPVSTLFGVDLGAKTYNAGGISFTINTASKLDVGLTSYVKAYTYVSAVVDDRSLQFQVGSDEGQTNRVGIAKMDVQTLFRGHNTDADYSNVDLSNTLKAQDLIGQVDDAINFVSAQNLKVGQFANSFARTLDVQRQNMTSISGALSNINDADMALEATNQSKRSILVQSGTAMVAQANMQGQFLLQLLR